MPFTLMIQADNLAIAQAALAGVARALAEETDPVSDQAELRFENRLEAPVVPAPAPAPEPAVEPAVEQKKRGRKPKLAIVEDVEPPPEVITEEEEPEAEGAVDTPEPAPSTTGVSELQLREVVREIMDAKGIPAALALLAKAGYKQVKDIPPADYDRAHAILTAKA